MITIETLIRDKVRVDIYANFIGGPWAGKASKQLEDMTIETKQLYAHTLEELLEKILEAWERFAIKLPELQPALELQAEPRTITDTNIYEDGSIPF